MWKETEILFFNIFIYIKKITVDCYLGIKVVCFQQSLSSSQWKISCNTSVLFNRKA